MNRRSLFSAFLLTILPRPSYAGLIENIFSKGKSWDVIVVGARCGRIISGRGSC